MTMLRNILPLPDLTKTYIARCVQVPRALGSPSDGVKPQKTQRSPLSNSLPEVWAIWALFVDLGSGALLGQNLSQMLASLK